MQYDLIVLGGRPGGVPCRRARGHAGLSVLCIEKNSVGGVCLNEGCIPTKTLLYSAKLYDGARYGDKYGVSAPALSIDHAKVVARKNKVVKLLVGGVKAALKQNGVTLAAGEGRIEGRGEEGFRVSVGGEMHSAAKLLIATGSMPVVPPISGLREAMERGFALTNREILALNGRAGTARCDRRRRNRLEMASYFNSIGSAVTVIEMLDHIAGENDAELTALLQKNYEKRGVRFLLGARVTEITETGVRYEKEGEAVLVAADKVLLSIGRRANTAELGLERIGVALERGAIVTDAHMRTMCPGRLRGGRCKRQKHACTHGLPGGGGCRERHYGRCG